jgi:hypothetical protein
VGKIKIFQRVKSLTVTIFSRYYGYAEVELLDCWARECRSQSDMVKSESTPPNRVPFERLERVVIFSVRNRVNHIFKTVYRVAGPVH